MRETNSGDISSDEESTGGDIPYDFGKRGDTANSGSPNADVGYTEERYLPGVGFERRVLHHTEPAKKSRSCSWREMEDANAFLIKHVEMGYTNSQVEEAYVREFNAIRTVNALLEKFELEHLKSKVKENTKIRNKRDSQACKYHFKIENGKWCWLTWILLN